MLNPFNDDFAAQLAAALPAAALRPVTPDYLEEPRGLYHGQAGAVVAPGSAQEVATVVRLAADARIGIVPRSGGTGLVSGQVMPDGPLPLILSMERMARIRAVNAEENVMIAEAGAILADVQAAAQTAGRLFPLALASDGSCRIGGNLATNAGGVNVLRYGNARDLCLGLEAVLPDGSIWNGLRRLRKDNTGYDLRNLLIGAEGTLGIITAATLRLFPRPATEALALLVVPSPGAALSLLQMAGDRLGGSISAFELISGMGLQFLADTMPDLRQPFAEPPEWMVLIDIGQGPGADPALALEELFAAGLAMGLVNDGLIAQSGAQRTEFWQLREMIPEGNRRVGAILSNDISLPLGRVAEFIDRATTRITALGPFRINCFGHLGDGNLHFNVFPEKGGNRAAWRALSLPLLRVINDLVAECEGSFSAEHGVGRAKVDELERYGDPAKLAAMRAIKSALDPAGIMNPGAVLRASN